MLVQKAIAALVPLAENGRSPLRVIIIVEFVGRSRRISGHGVSRLMRVFVSESSREDDDCAMTYRLFIILVRPGGELLLTGSMYSPSDRSHGVAISIKVGLENAIFAIGLCDQHVVYVGVVFVNPIYR